VLLITQKAQQHIGGQSIGDESGDGTFFVLWAEKGWAEGHGQEASKANYDRDTPEKKKMERR